MSWPNFEIPPLPTLSIPGIVNITNAIKGNKTEVGEANLAESSSISLVSDNFVQWLALSKADFKRVYGYELVTYDTKANKANRLALPVNPQNITISVPAAISTSVTMKGITEEHNGAPLRHIVISGTTGVMSSSTSQIPAPSSAPSSLEYLFRNTIQAGKRVITQVQKIASAVSNDNSEISSPINARLSDITNSSSGIGLGYMFIHNLARFLDSYLAVKKTTNGRSKRLVFQMYKDKMYYDCTLNGYSITKQAGTIEYYYTINLTAWRRRANPVPDISAKRLENIPSAAASLSNMAKAVNALRNARRAIAAAHGVMAGIRADINDSLIQPMREIALFGIDLANLGLTAYDFAGGPRGGVRTTVSIFDGFKQSFNQVFRDNGDVAGPLNELLISLGIHGTNNGDGGTGPVTASLQEQSNANKSDLSSTSDATADPLQKIIDNAFLYPQIFEDISIDSLNLTAAAQAQIDSEMERVRSLTSQDFRVRRDMMQNFATSIAEGLGGGSASYNKTTNRPEPKKVFKQLSLDDVVLLDNLNQVIMATDSLISNMEELENSTNDDYYGFYRDYAVAEGLDFSSSVSKFFVPFPYGSTLESLAVQYLGSPDRWIEIAALNALKAPYIDEEGFEVPLTSTGAGMSVAIANIDNLYVGQVVKIVSKTQQPRVLKIRGIDVLSTVEAIIQFDGEGSLANYTITDGSKLQAYLPNTVNSLRLIAIPSTEPVSVAGRLKTTIEDKEDLNGLAQIAKVDFLLQSDGDLVLSGSGDVALASGLTNIVQAALLKLQTRQGSIIQHPEYGNLITAGISTADVTAKDLIDAINKSFDEDTRFQGVQAATITKTGPSVSMNILVNIANTDVTLPIGAQLPL